MEIKNKREDLYASELPPKILSEDDVEDIVDDVVSDAGYLTEEGASTAGFVKDTDYPTSSVGGVVKLNSNRAVGHANGALQAVTVTAENYDAMNAAAFVGKGTLENIIGVLVKRELIALLGGTDEDVDGTSLESWFATKVSGEWTVGSVKDTPTPP